MSNASDYADGIVVGIQRMTDAGAPFGWTHPDTEEWAGDMPDGWETDEDCEWYEATALDYLGDVLDIEYRVGSDGQYRSAKILVAFGGPNVWIDTGAEQLIVTWWSAPEHRELPSAFIAGLDEALAELWECR